MRCDMNFQKILLQALAVMAGAYLAGIIRDKLL